MKYTIHITDIDNVELNLVVAAINKIEFDRKDFSDLEKKLAKIKEERKVCLKCLYDKPLSEYYKNKGTYFNTCKKCSIEYSKEQALKRKEEKKIAKETVRQKGKWSRRAKNLARKKTPEAPHGYKLDGTPRKQPGVRKIIKEPT
jgi:hypothetical protein